MKKNLSSPEFKVTIGNYTLEDGIEVECVSSKKSYCDWCSVELTEELKDQIVINDMDEAVVYMGYNGEYVSVIEGYVRMLKSDYWGKFLIKDDMIKLERNNIKCTFLMCTPQDILKYILGIIGITEYKLSNLKYTEMERFSVPYQNCIDLLKNINAAWKMDVQFYFRNRCFYWGYEEEQNEIYMLEENETILSMNKYNGLWEVETIGIPWIHYGEKINIQHEKYSGTVEVFKTIIKRDRKGFVRMYIYFMGE